MYYEVTIDCPLLLRVATTLESQRSYRMSLRPRNDAPIRVLERASNR